MAVHEAVSKNPELDIMHWVMRRVPLWRLTNRHAVETPNHSPSISHTKDGRWFMSHGMGARDLKNLVPLLNKIRHAGGSAAAAAGCRSEGTAGAGSPAGDETRAHMLDVVQRFIRAWTYADMPWREAQDAGLLWAPLRKPHENALDEHWLRRKSFADVPHPEHGRSLPLSDQQVAQHGDKLASRPARAAAGRGHRNRAGAMRRRRPTVPAQPRGNANPRLSARHGKPFPLQGVKILRFRLVPRVGWRHAVPRRDGRGKLQG